MSNETGRLALDDCPEALAFRALDVVLHTDPTLARLETNFRAFRGTEDDWLPPNGAYPFVQLTPIDSGGGWKMEGQSDGSIDVRYRIAVAGTRAEDLMNFGRAIVTALFPPAGTERKALVDSVWSAAGVYQVTIKANPIEPKGVQDDARALASEGRVRLSMFMNT